MIRAHKSRSKTISCKRQLQAPSVQIRSAAAPLEYQSSSSGSESCKSKLPNPLTSTEDWRAPTRSARSSCIKRSTGHTHTHSHTHTPTENNTTDTDTHAHDKNNTPNPQTNTYRKHLTTLEGGAKTGARPRAQHVAPV